MHAVKLVVAGAFNAGKSQLIAAASEIEPVRTERRVTDQTAAVKPLTTTAMDYGRLTLPAGRVLHLYGTPGQSRFDFMWHALARGMNGLLLVVDSADPARDNEARAILGLFARIAPGPRLVAANKQDLPGARSGEALRESLGLDAATPVLPCRATDPDSARAVLGALSALVTVADRSLAGAQPLAPIAPRPPAPLAAVTWGAGQHLTQGDRATLCGRMVPASALPALIYNSADCRSCAERAAALGLCCAACGRPLTRSADGERCLGCAHGQRMALRDMAHAFDF